MCPLPPLPSSPSLSHSFLSPRGLKAGKGGEDDGREEGASGVCPCWLWTPLGSAGSSWAQCPRFWGKSMCSGPPFSFPALCVGDLHPFCLFIPFLSIPPLLCLFCTPSSLVLSVPWGHCLFISACSPNTGRSILCVHLMRNHPSPEHAPSDLCHAPHPVLSHPTALPRVHVRGFQ